MDGEGIDAVLLYPTIGIAGKDTSRTVPSRPRTRAPYNRWLADFCRAEPTRLYPVAHISLLDPEARWRNDPRAPGTAAWESIFPGPSPRAAGRHFDDPVFARFWETAQARDAHWLPRGSCGIGSGSGQWQRRDPSDGLFSIVFLAIDSWRPSTQMLSAGMFEPLIRACAASCSEADRLDRRWLDAWTQSTGARSQTPIRMPPSQYFYRHA